MKIAKNDVQKKTQNRKFCVFLLWVASPLRLIWHSKSIIFSCLVVQE